MNKRQIICKEKYEGTTWKTKMKIKLTMFGKTKYIKATPYNMLPTDDYEEVGSYEDNITS